MVSESRVLQAHRNIVVRATRIPACSAKAKKRNKQIIERLNREIEEAT